MKRGAISVEMILLLALIVLPLLIALVAFRVSIVGMFQDQVQQLQDSQ